MKARFIPKSALKTTMELEAERLLAQLTADKAIEITLESHSALTVKRAFAKAANSKRKPIRTRTQGNRVYVMLKGK